MVRLLQDTNTAQCLAMKMISKIDIHCELTQIESETQIMVTLRHPFILRLHSTFQCSNYFYLMLEYAEGGSLFQLLCRHGRFKEDEVRFYACEIVLALECLHL